MAPKDQATALTFVVGPRDSQAARISTDHSLRESYRHNTSAAAFKLIIAKSRALKPEGQLPRTSTVDVLASSTGVRPHFTNHKEFIIQPRNQIRVPLQAAVNKGRRTLLLGDLGTGKSTMVATLVSQIQEQNQKGLALIAPAKELHFNDQLTVKELFEIVSNYFSSQIAPASEPLSLEMLLKLDWEITLIVDGLDELTHYRAATLLSRLGDAVDHWPTIRVIATARPVELHGVSFEDWNVFSMAPLSDDEKLRFFEEEAKAEGHEQAEATEIARRLMAALRKQPRLSSLANTPLIVRLLYSKLSRDERGRPETLGDILTEVVNNRLGDWGTKDRKPALTVFEREFPDANSRGGLLGQLALLFAQRDSISVDEAKNHLRDLVSKYSNKNPLVLSNEALEFFGRAGLITISDLIRFTIQPLYEVVSAFGLASYGFDAVGRLTGVTGSDTLYAGVSNYASNMKYRAWDGLKQMTDGSNHTSNVGYNARLQVSYFDVTGNVVSQNYNYYNDGRISFVQNVTDANFDRSYSYDHAGRITEAKSGGQARNGYGDVPYHETFTYENWGNVTYRLNESWNGDQWFEDSATYANNRRVGWGYDADGRNTTVETRTNSYDAAGRQVSMTGQQWIFNHYTPVSQTSGYDGDGNKVQVGTGAAATYYLQSSALGGVLVAELSSSGQKNVGYVYVPGGELLAEQFANAVTWRHVTPAGTGKYDTYSNLSYSGRVEFDPLGADINLTGPTTPDTGGGDGDVGTYHFGGLMSRLTSDFFNTANDCMVNGSRESCSVAMFIVNMGTGRGDFTKDSSTTMDDMGKALGVAFTPTGLSPNSLMSSAINGTADFTYNVMGWAEDPATKIQYWVPIPTYFIGIPAEAGSAMVLIGALALLRPPLDTEQTRLVQDGINRAGELYDKERCKTFINAVLQRAAATVERLRWAAKDNYMKDSSGVYAGINFVNALDMYANAFDKGWVSASGKSGAKGDSTVYGTTTPTGHYPVSWNNEFFSKLTHDERGLHTFHEALHQFSGFDDATLAEAARFVDGEKPKDYSKEKDPVGAASQDLNQSIQKSKNCGP